MFNHITVCYKLFSVYIELINAEQKLKALPKMLRPTKLLNATSFIESVVSLKGGSFRTNGVLREAPCVRLSTSVFLSFSASLACLPSLDFALLIVRTDIGCSPLFRSRSEVLKSEHVFILGFFRCAETQKKKRGCWSKFFSERVTTAVYLRRKQKFVAWSWKWFPNCCLRKTQVLLWNERLGLLHRKRSLLFKYKGNLFKRRSCVAIETFLHWLNQCAVITCK